MLVGGQTRMPMVQERLTSFFGKAPSKGVHPDEAVAIGAALYAHSLEDDTNLKLQLLDVIPMAIGLEKAGGEFHVVFPRNAAIPNAKQIRATTSFDEQTELAMRIFQGDHEQVSHNELLGEFTFSGIRPAPAGDGAGGDHLRRQHRGHPHHERARPDDGPGDEDHRPRHAVLDVPPKRSLGGLLFLLQDELRRLAPGDDFVR